MSDNTLIDYATASWSPLIGCCKRSEGCRNCWALTMARRIAGKSRLSGGVPPEYEAVVNKSGWTGKTALIPKYLETPFHWKKRRNIATCFMTDIAYCDHPYTHILQVFSVMAMLPRHNFLILTKRPEALLKILDRINENGPGMAIGDAAYEWTMSDDAECQTANSINGCLGEGYNVGWPMKNVWLGCSVEDDKAAMRTGIFMQDISELGWNTWVSSEPRIGAIDWNGWEFIDWLVTGGEAGQGARPMHPEWALHDLAWAKHNNIPFFFKQWGKWAPCRTRYGIGKVAINELGKTDPLGQVFENRGKKKAGRLLDGKEYNELPEGLRL